MLHAHIHTLVIMAHFVLLLVFTATYASVTSVMFLAHALWHYHHHKGIMYLHNFSFKNLWKAIIYFLEILYAYLEHLHDMHLGK